MFADLRAAVRALRRAPGFAAAAVLCAALGVGANTAIFSAVSGVLLRPLPFPDPGRLVVVWERLNGAGHTARNVASPADFLDWRAGTNVFADVGALVDVRAPLTDVPDPEEVAAEYATAGVFAALGARPAAGRAITADDDRPGAEPVAVVSDAFWRRRFGASPRVLGTLLTLRGTRTRVVGVMPPGFRTVGAAVDVWMPLGLDPAADYRATAGRFLTVVGRLRPGVTREGAQAALAAVARRLAAEHPKFNEGWGVNVVPLAEQLAGDARRPLGVLAGVAGLVLLIACADVANLQLARAAGRRQELALRGALGAGRWRLARRLLAESVVVAVAGGVLGVGAAAGAVRAFVARLPDFPRAADVGLDWRVLLFACAATVVTGFLFGVLPAFGAARVSPGAVLRAGGRGAVGEGPQRVRGALVGAQVALALVLLVGAGLLLKSFDRLLRESPGFAPEQVLTAQLTPPKRYATDAARAAFVARVVERAGAIRGVRAAGAVSYLPFVWPASRSAFSIEGRPPLPPAERPTAEVRIATAGYFGAMGIPLRRGAVFTGREARDGDEVVVIDETFARRYFAGEDPVGRRLAIEWDRRRVARVIGVVGAVRLTGLDSLPVPTAYWPASQFGGIGRMAVAVRLAPGVHADAAAALRAAVRAEDPGVPLGDVKTMDGYLAESLARRTLVTALVAAFGAVALALATVGVYAVVAYGVAQRTREFGVRSALGARGRDLVRLVAGRGTAPAAAGAAVGIAGALALTRFLGGTLYGVAPVDAGVFGAATALLVGVAAAASWLPARRAARVDPAVALRAD